MPGFDGTGPQGLGPMTGGGRGFCALPAGRAPVAYPQAPTYSAWGALNPLRWIAARWGSTAPWGCNAWGYNVPWSYGGFRGRGGGWGRGRGRGGW